MSFSHRKLQARAGILACLIVLLVIAVSPATAKPMAAGHGPGLQRDLDALVAGGAPGAILLVRGQHGTERLTAGVAEIATGRPMHPGDRYRIASLAKTYVSTVVLQLVEERKLRLRDSVEKWLPGLVPNGENIRIRHLLGHTSGLFDFEDDPRLVEPYLSGDLSYYWSPLERLALAISHEPLYPPGETTKSTYSNTNYTIAGLIVEAATGKSIQAQLRQRIFKPLDLDATTYPDRETTIEGRHARGYFLLGPPPLVDVTEFSPSITGAGGAIVSTVGEVARFYRALLKGRLLRPDLLRAMKRTLPSDGDPGAPTARYGLGIEKYATTCGTAWGHSGSFPGYLTYTFSSPDGKRQMVLMVNIDPSAIPAAARQQFYDLLDKAYCSTR
jgi:D-alanyl-D-alanine carboxypeptidase